MLPELDGYSLRTVPIEARFNETPLGSATAFVWRNQPGHYLITNWHVVTGRNFTNGQHVDHIHRAEPNNLRCLFNPPQRTWGKIERQVQLIDESGNPTWYVHPVHRNQVDVVAIPLPRADGEVRYDAINDGTDYSGPMKIGMDVFILGYPFGAPPPSFPVWKRGSIASEPDLVRLGDKYMLVDTASRPGMSGSPVIWRTYGAHVGPNSKFIGVYSGRLFTKNTEDAQLGIVWPPSFVEEIVESRTLDDPQKRVFRSDL